MLQFNVIRYNINTNKFEFYDIIPYLVNYYNEQENKPSTFEEFREFILNYSTYQWWARCEHEIILSDWPTMKDQEKWDVHKQIKMNIDIITTVLMTEIYDSKRDSNT